jgi:threonyl-tRNA synthetase
MNITDRQAAYASRVEGALSAAGFRAVSDLRNEKIGFKIREHTLERVPYLLVVGDREVEADAVAVRTRKGQDLGAMPLDEFRRRLSEDIASRSRGTEEG